MTRISTLSFLVLYILFSFSAPAQNVYVANGNSTNYNLADGDSLYVQGNYTGSIGSFAKGAKITVAANATFQPSSFSNPRGTLTVLGTAKFNSISTNKDFRVENYGIIEISGGINMNNTQYWNNRFGAKLKFSGAVSLNGAEIYNDGIITATSTFTLNNDAELTNNNTITISGAFTSNGATIINLGKLEGAGVTLNSGTSFTNNCRLVVDGNLTINNTTLYNDGLVWIPAQYTTASITNSGTFQNKANGRVKARNFTNYGVVNGKGYYYFYGTTYNSGTVGVSGTTTDTIKVYDATRTSASTIFDTQYGTVRANAIFASFAAPDTTNATVSCSFRYASTAASALLPVKWNYFYVNLASNTPVLSWSSEQDPGTEFQVERSYDGKNFTAISTVSSVTGKTNYQYEDKQVNNQSPAVYYRIVAVELSGAQKISETKVIRFSSKQGVSIQTAPNPFTSQFSIHYQSAERGTLTVRIYGMSGQLQTIKNVTVSKGFNSITVTEAASLAKGFYMVQITGDNNNLIASEKIVKQ